jgi:PadR family transcriptional regulator PadR
MLTRSDEYILLAVWHLEASSSGAYGSTVLDYLDTHSDSSWSLAGVYAPLKRMTSLGYLRSNTGPPTPERGGRRKRLYTLTTQGRSALEAAHAEYKRIWSDAQVPVFAPLSMSRSESK